MKYLLGYTLSELKELSSEYGLPAFTAKQIAEWLYKKRVRSIDEMTNLSKKAREKLKEDFQIGFTNHVDVQTSVDGTKKYLYPVQENKFVEAAYIPDKDRATLCVSSQVGCKMGCLFCMTARQGFQGQLSVNQIMNQILNLPEFESLTNLVYMGMGEPFDNLENVLKSLEIITSDYGLAYSPKRITVSTIGIIPGMKEFLENSNCHLAVSLHTPFDDERRQLMPVENVFPVQDVVKELKHYDLGKQRRISFEYIMFKGLNDTARHVKELARLLNGLNCRMNLIRFHPIPNSPLQGSDDTTIEHFKHLLSQKGIRTTVRASRGEDIFAACGLLSTKKLLNEQEKDH